MRLLMIFAMILLFFGCSEEKKPTKPSIYLTKIEVEKKLDEYYSQELREELIISDEMRSRLNNLLDDEKLLDGLKELLVDPPQDRTNHYISTQDIDYREFDQPIGRQWNGTCTAWATIGMMETLSAMKYDKAKNLSERDLWSKPEVFERYSAYGAYKGAQNHFIVPEKIWPHYTNQPQYVNHTQFGFTKIKNGWYLGDDYSRLHFRMSQEETAKIAMRVPYSMGSCDAVINPQSNAIDGAGHDIAISGVMLSEKYGPIAIIKNSWGEGCGDKGYQYLPLSICDRPSYYCYFWTASELEFKIQ